MSSLRSALFPIVIILSFMSGYACAGETWEEASPLPISRHPAKVVPRRVLPVTPDMAGEEGYAAAAYQPGGAGAG